MPAPAADAAAPARCVDLPLLAHHVPVGMMPTAPSFSASITGSRRQASEPSGSTCTNCCCRRAGRSAALAAAAVATACRRCACLGGHSGAARQAPPAAAVHRAGGGGARTAVPPAPLTSRRATPAAACSITADVHPWLLCCYVKNGARAGAFGRGGTNRRRADSQHPLCTSQNPRSDVL